MYFVISNRFGLSRLFYWPPLLSSTFERLGFKAVINGGITKSAGFVSNWNAQVDIFDILEIQETDLPLSIHNMIQRGLPFSYMSKFADRYKFTQDKAATTVFGSESTLYRRKKTGILNQAESDTLVRYIELYALADNVLDGCKNAAQWMSEPNFSLGDKTPLDYAKSSYGARHVESLLVHIKHGISA